MSDGYHSDYSSVSRTMLNLFRQSRWEYYLTYVRKPAGLQPKQPTAPMLKGTVLHSILLEDKTLDDLVLCYPEDCFNFDRETEQRSNALNGRRAGAFRDAHPEQICFKESEYDDIAECVNSVLEHKNLREVLAAATHKEQRFDAVLDGLPCRIKPDISCDMDDHIAVADLKFSLNIDPISWRRMVKRCGLWLQDAHYSRVMSAAFDKPVKFWFWNIEIKPPYRVQHYHLDQNGRAEAHLEHRKLMLQLAECYASELPPRNAWSDNWSPVTVVDPNMFETETNDEVQCEA